MQFPLPLVEQDTIMQTKTLLLGLALGLTTAVAFAATPAQNKPATPAPAASAPADKAADTAQSGEKDKAPAKKHRKHKKMEAKPATSDSK
jgi:hypothetical protein